MLVLLVLVRPHQRPGVRRQRVVRLPLARKHALACGRLIAFCVIVCLGWLGSPQKLGILILVLIICCWVWMLFCDFLSLHFLPDFSVFGNGVDPGRRRRLTLAPYSHYSIALSPLAS